MSHIGPLYPSSHISSVLFTILPPLHACIFLHLYVCLQDHYGENQFGAHGGSGMLD